MLEPRTNVREATTVPLSRLPPPRASLPRNAEQLSGQRSTPPGPQYLQTLQGKAMILRFSQQPSHLPRSLTSPAFPTPVGPLGRLFTAPRPPPPPLAHTSRTWDTTAVGMDPRHSAAGQTPAPLYRPHALGRLSMTFGRPGARTVTGTGPWRARSETRTD